jgi:hypothetical protein
VCTSMRIRTADHPHREDAIEGAAEFYDCNKTTAVVSACEDVPELVRAVRQVLERDDLTARQRREIADTLSTRAVSFDVQTDVAVQRDP